MMIDRYKINEENNPKVKKVYIGWEEIMEMCTDIVTRIRNDNFVPDFIHAIPRGGLIPATIIAHMLKVDDIFTSKHQWYFGKVLMVDEIIDTGNTMNKLTMNCNKLKVASLFYKPWSRYIPDYYIRETIDYIIFPWETSV
jgi:hypoxanthine phosphoribosyltransferase